MSLELFLMSFQFFCDSYRCHSCFSRDNRAYENLKPFELFWCSSKFRYSDVFRTCLMPFKLILMIIELLRIWFRSILIHDNRYYVKIWCHFSFLVIILYLNIWSHSSFSMFIELLGFWCYLSFSGDYQAFENYKIKEIFCWYLSF